MPKKITIKNSNFQLIFYQYTNGWVEERYPFGTLCHLRWMCNPAVSVTSLLLYIKFTAVNIYANHVLQNLSVNVYQRLLEINWIYPPMLEMNQEILP